MRVGICVIRHTIVSGAKVTCSFRNILSEKTRGIQTTWRSARKLRAESHCWRQCGFCISLAQVSRAHRWPVDGGRRSSWGRKESLGGGSAIEGQTRATDIDNIKRVLSRSRYMCHKLPRDRTSFRILVDFSELSRHGSNSSQVSYGMIGQELRPIVMIFKYVNVLTSVELKESGIIRKDWWDMRVHLDIISQRRTRVETGAVCPPLSSNCQMVTGRPPRACCRSDRGLTTQLRCSCQYD